MVGPPLSVRAAGGGGRSMRVYVLIVRGDLRIRRKIIVEKK
jgi:hypothetical protein